MLKISPAHERWCPRQVDVISEAKAIIKDADVTELTTGAQRSNSAVL